MFNPTVEFEQNCWVLSKFIDWKPQFSEKVKKGHNSVEILQITPFSNLPVFFYYSRSFCKV